MLEWISVAGLEKVVGRSGIKLEVVRRCDVDAEEQRQFSRFVFVQARN